MDIIHLLSHDRSLESSLNSLAKAEEAEVRDSACWDLGIRIIEGIEDYWLDGHLHESLIKRVLREAVKYIRLSRAF